MSVIRQLAVLAVAWGLAGCHLFRLPAKKAPPPTREGGVIEVSITRPAISRDGPLLHISSAHGLVATIDMRELVDPDDDFKAIGDDPEMDWIAQVLTVAVEDLFEMGYYDMDAHHLTQEQINGGLARIKISRPVRVLKPGADPSDAVVGLFAFESDRLLGMTWMSGKGKDFGVGTVHRLQSAKAARMSEVYPAFTRNGAERALQRFAPGSRSQAIGSWVRTYIHFKNLPGGPAVFYWVPQLPSPQVVVKSNGTVLQLNSGFSLQTVQRRSVQAIKLGRVEGDPADFAGLRK